MMQMSFSKLAATKFWGHYDARMIAVFAVEMAANVGDTAERTRSRHVEETMVIYGKIFCYNKLTKFNFRAGYSKIFTIPLGARKIQITEDAYPYNKHTLGE